MITGITGASIWSEDLNNLFPFYRDVLGLNVAFESPQFVGLGDPNGAMLGIGTHSEVRGKAADPHRHILGVASNDLDVDYQRLTAAGVEFIEPPTDYEGVRIATLRDPEGNLVQLFQGMPEQG